MVRRSAIEENHGAGLRAIGSDVRVEATVVRGTLPATQEVSGFGVSVEHDDGAIWPERSIATIRGSLIESNRDTGLLVIGSDMRMEATAVRGTAPNAQGVHGFGVQLQEPSSAAISGSLLEGNHETGLLIIGSTLNAEATIVRGTLPSFQGARGFGVSVQDNPDTDGRSMAIVRGLLVESNHDTGLLSVNSDLMVEATVVRETLADAQGLSGKGIHVTTTGSVADESVALIRGTALERNREVGLLIAGSRATIEANIVRDTMPNAYGVSGLGISVQDAVLADNPSTATIQGTVLESNHEAGLLIVGSDAIISATAIRATKPNAWNQYGDGISIASRSWPATAVITGVDVGGSARASVSSFGATLELHSSAIGCGQYDITTRPLIDYTDEVHDLENVCGCPVPNGACRVSEIRLEAPRPVPAIDPGVPAGPR
jgi:hypothetical protein